MKYNTGLSENEWYIMQILWDRSSASLRELCNALKDSKGWTKHAISSFLKRMQEKGAITADESGKVKEYFPIWDKDETILRNYRVYCYYDVGHLLVKRKFKTSIPSVCYCHGNYCICLFYNWCI